MGCSASLPLVRTGEARVRGTRAPSRYTPLSSDGIAVDSDGAIWVTRWERRDRADRSSPMLACGGWCYHVVVTPVESPRRRTRSGSRCSDRSASCGSTGHRLAMKSWPAPSGAWAHPYAIAVDSHGAVWSVSTREYRRPVFRDGVDGSMSSGSRHRTAASRPSRPTHGPYLVRGGFSAACVFTNVVRGGASTLSGRLMGPPGGRGSHAAAQIPSLILWPYDHARTRREGSLPSLRERERRPAWALERRIQLTRGPRLFKIERWEWNAIESGTRDPHRHRRRRPLTQRALAQRLGSRWA